MVVLSIDAFENMQFERSIFNKLQEAEKEAELTNTRFPAKDVLKVMEDTISLADIV